MKSYIGVYFTFTITRVVYVYNQERRVNLVLLETVDFRALLDPQVQWVSLDPQVHKAVPDHRVLRDPRYPELLEQPEQQEPPDQLDSKDLSE